MGSGLIEPPMHYWHKKGSNKILYVTYIKSYVPYVKAEASHFHIVHFAV